MNTKELVHYVAAVRGRRTSPAKPITAPSYHQLLTPLRSAVARARQYLLSQQQPDGSWRGHQGGDASLAGSLVLTLAYLGREESELAAQAAAAILEQQLPLGGWSRIPDGPPDLGTSVRAYFALKVTGHDPSDARLALARDVIRSLGGADAADGTTRLFLAILGQVDYDLCLPLAPNLPPAQSGCQAPLAVVVSHRPVRDVGLARGVRELFIKRPADWPLSGGHPQRWLAAVRRRAERRGWLPLRRALDRAESAVVARVLQHDGCQPGLDELVWLTVALHALGYDADSRPMVACEAMLRDMVFVDGESDVVRPQLFASTCRDTAVAVETLCTSGVQLDHIASSDAVGWLPRPERRCGMSGSTMELASLLSALVCVEDQAADDVLPPDIQVASPWAAGQANAAERCQSRRRFARHAAGRLVERVLARQNPDGGWPAVDGARPSGSAADVTGAVLVALALYGKVAGETAIDRAVALLRSAQRADGSWDSAAGVGLVHGTSWVVRGLTSAHVGADDPAVAAGLNWLVVHQQPSGGWGETVDTAAADADYRSARPTASQTAWALQALSAAGRSLDDAACRGVHFLLETQEDDGHWDEPHFTLRDSFTGRWYRSDLYAVTGPLAALSRWAVAAAQQPHEAGRVQLRLVGAEAI